MQHHIALYIKANKYYFFSPNKRDYVIIMEVQNDAEHALLDSIHFTHHNPLIKWSLGVM